MERKKRTPRVQGAWGGGGGRGGGRGVGRGTGGVTRGGGSERRVWNANIPASDESAVITGVDSFSSPNGSSFVFQQPTAESLLRPPDPLHIHTEGVYTISGGEDANASREEQAPDRERGPTKNAEGKSVIRFYPGFVEGKEADWMMEDLLAQLPWEQKINSLPGRDPFTEPRLTAWFGDFPYHYSGVQQNPHPWNPIMTAIKDKVEAFLGRSFNSCLANYYRNDKDSIGWHSDDEPALGPRPVIASLSFGDVRLFELRKKPAPGMDQGDFSLSETVKVPLPHGSLLVMEGRTQEDWQHRVPREYHDRGARVNLTFRTIYP